MNILFTGLFALFISSASNPTENYLEQYSAIAVAEMQRTGIPASIKLAQGLLESDYGRSELARRANNHFGIKCGTSWDGPSYFREDDDYSRQGELMKSCFRVYSSPAESFAAHSDFLTDPKKQYRYGNLFELPASDYKAWAEGLKRAGYATDPKYPEKLIYIIEKYNLTQYDATYIPQRKELAEAPTRQTIRSDENTRSKGHNRRVELLFVNESRYVLPREEESVAALANRVGLPVSDLIEYNDHLRYPDQPCDSHLPVFLELKSRDFHGEERYYTVKEGESLEDISQKLGVRISTLQSLNRISKNADPLPGEKLNLKDKIKASDRPKCKRKESVEFIF